MFDRINSTSQLKAAELYVSVEPRIEVGGEDVQQTTLEGGDGEEFQSLHVDSHPTLIPCTTIRGYTLPCQETPTPMEVCGSSYQQECIQSLGGKTKMKMKTKTMLIMVEISMKRGLGEITFTSMLITMKMLTMFIMMLWMI